VERALAYEAQRQYEQWRQTGQRLGEVPKQTRGWDEAAQLTRPQRSKEESSDYRYFPEPDLLPVTTTEEEVQRVQESLGELPAALRARLEETYGIAPYDSDVLVNQGRALVDYYVEVAETCGDAKQAANWVQQDVLRTLNQQQIDIAGFPVSAAALGGLISLIRAGRLPGSRGREVFEAMLNSGRSAEEAIQGLGIQQVDDSALEQLCRELVAANPQVVAQVKQGKLKAAAALVGQAKKRNPNVDPGRVREICLELMEKL
jgi:aspartyl-tRNA(Asn)/glutamyl-tRNA(Gln) amidotransferase subunit B